MSKCRAEIERKAWERLNSTTRMMITTHCSESLTQTSLKAIVGIMSKLGSWWSDVIGSSNVKKPTSGLLCGVDFLLHGILQSKDVHIVLGIILGHFDKFSQPVGFVDRGWSHIVHLFNPYDLVVGLTKSPSFVIPSLWGMAFKIYVFGLLAIGQVQEFHNLLGLLIVLGLEKSLDFYWVLSISRSRYH